MTNLLLCLFIVISFVLSAHFYNKLEGSFKDCWKDLCWFLFFMCVCFSIDTINDLQKYKKDISEIYKEQEEKYDKFTQEFSSEYENDLIETVKDKLTDYVSLGIVQYHNYLVRKAERLSLAGNVGGNIIFLSRDVHDLLTPEK